MTRGLTKRLGIVSCAAIVLLTAATAFAHHSLTMFDKSKSVTVEGIIKKFDWTNPHTWIHVIVHNESSDQEQEWMIEAPNPTILERSGWTQASLKIGDKAVVAMHPSKDPEDKKGLLVTITVNGQKVWRNPFE